MSEAAALPPNPDLDWYKKSAKRRLDQLRLQHPDAKLAEAQLAVAREHGFSSWRSLKTRIDQITDLPKLFDAIRIDDRTAIRALLKAKPSLARMASPEGQTAILVAAETNNPDAIEILLRNRADPQAYFSRSGHDALSWALTVGATESAQTLVRCGIQPDFFSAAGLGDLDRVRSFSILSDIWPITLPVPVVRAGSMERECPCRRCPPASESRTLSISRAGMDTRRSSRSCSAMTRTFRFGHSWAGQPCTGPTTAANAKWSTFSFVPAPIPACATRSTTVLRERSASASPPVGDF